jgi:glycosyltransferase involved in cell wall biosynthesis
MRALFLNPFHTGSHAQFARTVTEDVPAEWTLHTLPGRHWKWRMRGAAVAFADQLASAPARFDVVLTTSYLPLAELHGLAPTLRETPTVLYFHENQLTYPTRAAHTGDRDHHYGFTQLVSCLAATEVWFNSAYNRAAFLAAGEGLLARMPDAVPTEWVPRIAARSSVVPFPMTYPTAPVVASTGPDVPAPHPDGPLILWNHRWEYDKGPDAMVAAVEALAAGGHAFRLAVCGQQFRDVPDSLVRLEHAFGAQLVQFGYVADRASYDALLASADIVLSTAAHEFFGVSMLEATHAGAYPLVPDRLAYPELFPAEYRYADDALVSRLAELVARYRGGAALRADRTGITARYARAVVCEDIAKRLRAM